MDGRDDAYDVVVVGGGAAGLGAALSLARSRRSVLVVDAGAPHNAAAGFVHNYLGLEGTPPAELLERGRTEVSAYGGEVVPGRVASAARHDHGFQVVLGDGRQVRARRLVVTTGVRDELPAVEGLAKRWGATSSTARTATGGRSATRRSPSSRPTQGRRCTKHCCSAS